MLVQWVMNPETSLLDRLFKCQGQLASDRRVLRHLRCWLVRR